MLRWRLFLGILLAAAVVGLCWLDEWLRRATDVPGLVLFPILLVLVVLASGEILHLAAAAGLRPVPWAVYGGNLLVVAGSWIGSLGGQFGWGPHALSTAPMEGTVLALSAGVILVFLGEMGRYEKAGGVTANLGAAVLAIVYVGLLSSFLIQLRVAWGVNALLSLLIVVKMSDSGAYVVGRLIGRRKMASKLSPGKTIEGALGALVLACISAWAVFAWLLPSPDRPAPAAGACWRWILFGVLVGMAGMVGDLAESLVKRDAGSKESSAWLPGFGGVLDLLDSVLLAAPVGCLLWALGVVR
jgi:phosphatidate cytidylyltransferase